MLPRILRALGAGVAAVTLLAGLPAWAGGTATTLTLTGQTVSEELQVVDPVTKAPLTSLALSGVPSYLATTGQAPTGVTLVQPLVFETQVVTLNPNYNLTFQDDPSASTPILTSPTGNYAPSAVGIYPGALNLSSGCARASLSFPLTGASLSASPGCPVPGVGWSPGSGLWSTSTTTLTFSGISSSTQPTVDWSLAFSNCWLAQNGISTASTCANPGNPPFTWGGVLSITAS